MGTPINWNVLDHGEERARERFHQVVYKTLDTTKLKASRNNIKWLNTDAFVINTRF